jgi:hypothetical protein
MADRSSFSDSEWNQLVESPMLAAMAVTAAEPSGLWGLLKESLAAGSSLAVAKAEPTANPLVKAVAAAYDTPEARTVARDRLQRDLQGSQPQEAKAKAIAGLGQVAALLEAKAPTDAAAFKIWLRHISQKVAEAGSEGGLLGFGGVKVSEVEKATLAEIEQALGMPR